MNRKSKRILSFLMSSIMVLSMFTGLNLTSIAENDFLLCDVDGDGYTTAADARLVLQNASRLVEFDDNKFAAADVDADGVITAADSRMILAVSAMDKNIEGAAPAREYLNEISNYDTEITLSAPTTMNSQVLVGYGDEVEITLSASEMEGAESANLIFEYDAEAFDFVSIDTLNDTDIALSYGCEYEEGKISFAFFYLETAQTSGDLAVITLKALSESCVTGISCESVSSWGEIGIPYGAWLDLEVVENIDPPYLEVENTTDDVEDTITVAVSGVNIAGLLGYWFNIDYDFEYLELTDVYPADYVDYADYNFDGVSFSLLYNEPVTEDSDLFFMDFNVCGRGVSEISLSVWAWEGTAAVPEDISVTIDTSCKHKNTTDDKGNEPTCTNVGYTAGVYCDDCYGYISGHEEIPMIEHPNADNDDYCDTCEIFFGEYEYVIKDGKAIITGYGDAFVGGDVVVLPSSFEGCPVTEIGPWALMYIENLTSLVIPDSVTKIGYMAIGGCVNLKSITIPSSVVDIDEWAFCDNTSLTDINLPQNLTILNNGLFSGCESLESIDLPDNIKEIGDYVFQSCTNLSDVNIPDSVEYIGERAFYECVRIDTIELHASLKRIGRYAFGDADGGTGLYNNEDNWTDGMLIYDNCLLSIDYDVWSTEEEIFIDENIRIIQDSALLSYNLKKITVDDNNKYYTSDENGVLYNKDKTELICYPAGKTEKQYIIPEGVITIGKYAFYDARVKNVLIPDTVTKIDDYAFYRSAVTILNLPDSVTEIGEWAFTYCSIKNVKLPKNLKIIGDCAFRYGNVWDLLEIPDGVTYIGRFAFVYGVKNVIIPKSVKFIDFEPFNVWNLYYEGSEEDWNNIDFGIDGDDWAHWSIREMNYNSDVSAPYEYEHGVYENIYYELCNGEIDILEIDWTNLEDISIPDTINGYPVTGIYGGILGNTEVYYDDVNWENDLFYIGKYLIDAKGDNAIYTVKDGTTVIADSAFDHMSDSLRTINLPESVKYIGDSAFSSNQKLEKINIPENVIRIGNDAFYGCKALTEITIPANVKSIGSRAFCNTGITEITILSKDVEIGNRAFGYTYNGLGTIYGYSLLDGVEIHGYAGSTAEAYAKENGIKFVALEEPTTQEPTTQEPTTQEPTTQEPTTQEPTTNEPSTEKPAEDGELDVKDESGIGVDSENKTALIGEESRVADITAAIENENIKVIDKNGDELAADDLLGTGSKIQIFGTDGNILAEYTVIVPNDIDGNAKVTAADARLALRAGAKLDVIDELCYFTAADVDGNGKINAADARKILRKAAGLE